MPCYKVTIPLRKGMTITEKCEEKYSTTESMFIRVGTVYGICGATFQNIGNSQIAYLPDVPGTDYSSVTDLGSCLIQ